MAGHKKWSELRETLTPQQKQVAAEKFESMQIGMLIHDMREKAGLTQAALADKLGVSQQAVSKLEYGDFSQLATLGRVFAALGGGLYLHTPTDQIPLSPPVDGMTSP